MKFLIALEVDPNQEFFDREVEAEVKAWLEIKLEEAIHALLRNNIIVEGKASIFRSVFLSNVKKQERM